MKFRFSLFCITLTVLCFIPVRDLPAEDTVDWRSDYSGTEPHTIALWKFDEPDITKNSYDGLANPEAYPVVGVNVSQVVTGVPGKFGTGVEVRLSVDFPNDNPSRVFSVAEPASLFHGPAMSVELWCRPASDSGNNGYLFDKMYNTKSGVCLRLKDKDMIAAVGNGRDIYSAKFAAPFLNPATWHHFAMTYKNVDGNGRLKVFVDGQLIYEEALAAFGDLDAGERFWTLERVMNFSGISFLA